MNRNWELGERERERERERESERESVPAATGKMAALTSLTQVKIRHFTTLHFNMRVKP